jgi:hypothetical protein
MKAKGPFANEPFKAPFSPDSEPALASGDSTPTFFFRGHLKLEVSQGVPLGAATKGYLIGLIGYSIPGREKRL